MSNFNRGENVNLLLWVKDPDDGSLVTPTETPTVEVLDPSGEVFLATSDMAVISTGYYGYSLPTLADSALGRYMTKYTVVDGDATTIHYDSFNLIH